MNPISSPYGIQFIRENCPVCEVPSLPEICLHKAEPNSGLWRLAEQDKNFDTPYWAYNWGGGLALARHILNRPQSVLGRRVLDLGCGSGIVGIAAMKAGAEAVIAADTDPYAIAVTGLNAAANGVRLQPFLGDLTAGQPPDVDVVLVGDLFYDRDLAARLSTFLDHCLGANVEVLIGDPWRPFLPLSRLQFLAEYPGPEFSDFKRIDAQMNAVFQWTLVPSRQGGNGCFRRRPDSSTLPGSFVDKLRSA